MKKIILLILTLIGIIPLTTHGYSTISENGIEIESIYANYSGVENFLYNNQSAVIEIWNNNTKEIGGLISPSYCPQFARQVNEKYNDFQKSETTRFSKYQTFQFIACYAYFHGKTISTIVASNESYRVHNINAGLSTIHGDVFSIGETYSILDNVFGDNSVKYVNGYALSYNAKTGKVTTFKSYGGGLCGVSTIVYQTALKRKGIEIVERYPHLNFYYSYYGPVAGLDATIYSGSKDFKMKNSSDQNIFIRTSSSVEGKHFIYNTAFYSPFKEENEIETTGVYKSGSRKCATITVGDNKTKSCYYGVYK